MNRPDKFYIFTLLIFILIGCTRKEPVSSGIQVANAMEQPSVFYASDLFDEISYIPLEINDSAVIGDYPDVNLLQDVILISSLNQNLKSFDRKTGKYLREIGHIGNDPEGYGTEINNISYWVDYSNNFLYFLGWENYFQCYDSNGNYKGKVTLGENYLSPSFYAGEHYFVIADKSIWGHKKMHWSKDQWQIARFRKDNGNLVDTIPAYGMPLPSMKDYVDAQIIYGAYVTYGGTVNINKFKDDKISFTLTNSPSLWISDDNIRLKEAYIDTIFTIKPGKRIPYQIFHLGKWHWDYDERFNANLAKDRITIDYVLEGKNLLYFHFHTGLYFKGSKGYCGIFDKRTKQTSIMEGDRMIDKTTGLSLGLRHVTPGGEFIALLQPQDILSQIEKKKLPLSTEWMKKLKEEDNPVIVILK